MKPYTGFRATQWYGTTVKGDTAYFDTFDEAADYEHVSDIQRIQDDEVVQTWILVRGVWHDITGRGIVNIDLL